MKISVHSGGARLGRLVSSILAISITFTGYGRAAANYTWTGTTNISWGATTNWTPNGTPTGADNIFFVQAPTNQPTNGSNHNVNNINFNNSAANVGFTLSQSGASTALGVFGGISAAGVNTVANTFAASFVLKPSGTILVTNNSPGALVFNGTIADFSASSASGVNYAGSGVINLNGANTYTLGGSIDGSSGGSVVVGNDSALGTGSYSLNAANLSVNGIHTLANAFTVNAGTSTLRASVAGSSLTLNGNLSSGAGAVLTEAAGSASYTLGGNNSSYQGTVRHANGTLFLSAATAGSASAAWEVDAAGLTLNSTTGGTYQFGSLSSASGNTAGVVTTGAAVSGQSYTLQIGALGSDTYAGTLTQAGGNTLGLTKIGTGAQTLSGVSTYTGATNVSAGSLLITGGLSGSTAMNISGSATLGIGMAAGGSAFASQTVATLNTGANGFESVIKLDLDGSGSDRLLASGAFTLNAEPVNLVVTVIGSFTGSTTLMTWGSGGFTNLATQLDLGGSSSGISLNNFSISGNSLIFTSAVPEPNFFTLFGISVLAVVFRHRRRLS